MSTDELLKADLLSEILLLGCSVVALLAVAIVLGAVLARAAALL